MTRTIDYTHPNRKIFKEPATPKTILLQKGETINLTTLVITTNR